MIVKPRAVKPGDRIAVVAPASPFNRDDFDRGVTELRRLCLQVAREFPHAVFFAGQLVFSEDLDGFLGRFLHNHTAFEMLRMLQAYGLSLVILPVRVSPRPTIMAA